ncbi:MAG: hypothetical protein ACRD3G_29625 [Vicinamibacterales bacterium]
MGVYSEGVSIGALTAGEIRAENFTIQRDVILGEHPSHVHLIEPGGTKGERRARQLKLAGKTRWIFGTNWLA